MLTFAGMQMFKTNLAASEWMTILGGFIGSQLFVFLLTVSFTKLLQSNEKLNIILTVGFKVFPLFFSQPFYPQHNCLQSYMNFTEQRPLVCTTSWLSKAQALYFVSIRCMFLLLIVCCYKIVRQKHSLLCTLNYNTLNCLLL